MRGLKQFFRMVVAAVICFTVSVFSRNKEEKIVKLLSNGQNQGTNANKNRVFGAVSNISGNTGSNVLCCSGNNRTVYRAAPVLQEQKLQNTSTVIEFKSYYGSPCLKKMMYRFLGPGDNSWLYEASG